MHKIWIKWRKDGNILIKQMIL